MEIRKAILVAIIGTFPFIEVASAGIFLHTFDELSGNREHDLRYEMFRAERLASRGELYSPRNVHLDAQEIAFIETYSRAKLREQQSWEKERAEYTGTVFTNSDLNKVNLEVIRQSLYFFLNRKNHKPPFQDNVLKITSASLFNQGYSEVVDRMVHFDARNSFENSQIPSILSTYIKSKEAKMQGVTKEVQTEKKAVALETIRQALTISAFQQTIFNQIWHLDASTAIAMVGHEMLKIGYRHYETHLANLSNMGVETNLVDSMSQALAQQIRLNDVGSHFYWQSKEVRRRYAPQVEVRCRAILN